MRYFKSCVFSILSVWVAGCVDEGFDDKDMQEWVMGSWGLAPDVPHGPGDAHGHDRSDQEAGRPDQISEETASESLGAESSSDSSFVDSSVSSVQENINIPAGSRQPWICTTGHEDEEERSSNPPHRARPPEPYQASLINPAMDSPWPPAHLKGGSIDELAPNPSMTGLVTAYRASGCTLETVQEPRCRAHPFFRALTQELEQDAEAIERRTQALLDAGSH